MFYTLTEVIDKYLGLVNTISIKHSEHPLYDVESIKKLSLDKYKHLEIGINSFETISSWFKNDYFVRQCNLIVEIELTNEGYTINTIVK